MFRINSLFIKNKTTYRKFRQMLYNNTGISIFYLWLMWHHCHSTLPAALLKYVVKRSRTLVPSVLTLLLVVLHDCSCLCCWARQKPSLIVPSCIGTSTNPGGIYSTSLTIRRKLCSTHIAFTRHVAFSGPAAIILNKICHLAERIPETKIHFLIVVACNNDNIYS